MSWISWTVVIAGWWLLTVGGYGVRHALSQPAVDLQHLLFGYAFGLAGMGLIGWGLLLLCFHPDRTRWDQTLGLGQLGLIGSVIWVHVVRLIAEDPNRGLAGLACSAAAVGCAYAGWRCGVPAQQKAGARRAQGGQQGR